MESLYLLIPLSIVLVLGIGALLAWSVMSGQFEDLDAEGRRILDDPTDEAGRDRTTEERGGPARSCAPQKPPRAPR
jgi:cbb3-type cytochrome oxidase maturation protein